jgi:hypothetical protein
MIKEKINMIKEKLDQVLEIKKEVKVSKRVKIGASYGKTVC